MQIEDAIELIVRLNVEITELKRMNEKLKHDLLFYRKDSNEVHVTPEEEIYDTEAH